MVRRAECGGCCGPGLADCFGVSGSGVGWSCCNIGGGGGCVVAVLCWTGGAASRDGMPVTKGGSSVVMACQASIVSSVVETDTWLGPVLVVEDSIPRFLMEGRSGTVPSAIRSCVSLWDGSHWNQTHIRGVCACKAEVAGPPSLFFLRHGEPCIDIRLVDVERVDIVSSWSVVLVCGVAWLA